MKNNTIEILKQLISIPSWIDNKNNEKKIGNWIINFLKNNTSLKIIKQNIGNGRFNIIALNSKVVNTLITGHIDTVQPNSAWSKKPINSIVAGDKLYGLGSSDMKCGIAVMLYLTTLSNLSENTAFLFYCDEEYDFLGMKEFIKKYKNKFKPKLIISLDGENLQIENCCRGLIELKISVEGKAGHAARPKSGINAITESMMVIRKLKSWLINFKSNELGSSTLNIAYINGGGSEGNIIAEKCEYIIEIRVANDKLNANLVNEFVLKESEKLGLKVIGTTIRHDLGSWITDKKALEKVIKIAPNKKIKKANQSGYIDIQMLWNIFGKVPTFSFGAGEKGMAHKAGEYVKISNVLKAQSFFKKILTKEPLSVVK